MFDMSHRKKDNMEPMRAKQKSTKILLAGKRIFHLPFIKQ